jgi:hypothetical protein
MVIFEHREKLLVLSGWLDAREGTKKLHRRGTGSTEGGNEGKLPRLIFFMPIQIAALAKCFAASAWVVVDIGAAGLAHKLSDAPVSDFEVVCQVVFVSESFVT